MGSSFDEFELIARMVRRLPPPGDFVRTGIGDDAAVLSAPRGDERVDEIVTCDSVVEGTHFDLRWMTPEDVGWRAMAVNASDVAAMGGSVRWAVVALEVRAGLDAAFFERLYDGIGAAAMAYGFSVVGGNVVGGALRLGVAVTMAGAVSEGAAWTRAGARVGDGVFVTGALGGAALGLASLKSGFEGGATEDWRERWRRPVARLGEAGELARWGGVTACIDLSDGLAQDVEHLARASGVGIRVDLAALPLAPDYAAGARRFFADPYTAAAASGDDYELAFSARGVPPLGTRIGDVVAGEGVVLVDRNGSAWTPPVVGYRQFRDQSARKPVA